LIQKKNQLLYFSYALIIFFTKSCRTTSFSDNSIKPISFTLFNFFNHSFIKSEEKIFSAENGIENIARKESITEEKTKIKKIHIVKSGDTISSISKLYSINKDFIIKLNNLKDENYIFIGQNLVISESTENLTKKSDLINNYHIVQTGENLTEISNKYDLKVIEDCAQATCTMWETSKVGSIGDIGCFSFFPTKNLGAAGDGGAVTTSDQKISKKIRELAVHGSPIRYHHTQIGYNSRLDTIQASILNIKIKYISKWINNRQKIANNYLNLLEKNPFISFPKISSDSISHSWNQFVIKLRNDKYFFNEDFSNLFDTDCKKYFSLRNLVKQQLFEKGINSIIYYPIPIHAQIAYKNKNFSRTKLINTERICTEVLSPPMFPEISYEEQVYVAENLNKVLKNCIEEIQISA